MNPIYPDYHNCSVNIANSILKHFGAPTHHETLPKLDQLLETKYQNIMVLLLDGCGHYILEKHLPADSFLRLHETSTLSAVFPPTTTAATTSICSGLTPMEHGWLGWNNYIPDIDQIVTMYMNTPKNSDQKITGYDVSRKYFPYTDLFTQLRQVGATAIDIDPYGGTMQYPEDDLDAFIATVKQACAKPGEKYIYGYFHDPDYRMHELGTDASEVHDRIVELDAKIAQLASELRDTLIIITSDHGHHDIEYRFLSDYPRLYETLLRPTSIETRAANFFIKPNLEGQFEQEFRQHFPEGFILLTKQEVIDQRLFGDGTENPRFRDCLGQFMAISTGDFAINDSHEEHQLASTHGGLTPAEMVTPFIAIDC
jgi:hypothetical protein